MKRLNHINEIELINISFQIPPDIKYLNFLEESIDLFFKTVTPYNDDETISSLRAVLNEGFVNVIEHSNSNNTTPIQFRYNSKKIEISISDYGKGLKINNSYPPYSRDMINCEFDLITVHDGKVKVKIIDPYSCKLLFESNDIIFDNKQNVINELQDRGRGLSIMIKAMDSVKFKYSNQNLNTLLLSKSL